MQFKNIHKIMLIAGIWGLTSVTCSNSKCRLAWRVGILAISWLIFISALHFWLNFEHGKQKIINIGYMPVITNLAAPILDYLTKENEGIRFSAMKFASFAEMAEALRNDYIHAAFIIAPLSIVLRQQGVDIKIIYIGNRHESTLVVRSDLNIKQLSDLAGRTIAVPIRYSGHNLSILQLLEKKGLKGAVNIVEMNPPDMASALTGGSLDAYYVGEPFAAKTIKSGHSKVLYYAEDVWKYFICNLVIVKQKFTENDPDIVQLLVQGAARSGLWAKEHPEEAAKIASEYWNQPFDLVKYALTTPENRIVYDRFIPKIEEMQYIADMMKHFGLIQNNDITGLTDDSFAVKADLNNITDVKSILYLP